ncbi:2-oxo acid dehydrogenase subunit E2 [Weeksellaceae bacterium TAE3-ERU29]|nr:2-oxo acid dehydrogenase subunit E2 [Weeksellaceae bacterium TAE3-ERU29]
MAEYKFLLPSMGEGVMEATVTTWLKSVGDKIEEDESIVEVATDKVDSDVPSPVSGVLKEIIVKENKVAKVGEAMAIIETESSNENDSNSIDNENLESEQKGEKIAEISELEKEVIEEVAKPLNNVNNKIISTEDNFFSPLVKSIAEKEGISIAELKNISGSGVKGRVTKDDILKYIKDGRSTKTVPNNQSEEKTPSSQPKENIFASTNVTAGTNEEIIEMDRMRKIIAQHMVDSVRTSPHVSSFVETDMTNIVLWRNKIKNNFQKREGEKITFMPIIVHAIIRAIKDFPMINVSVEGDKIIKKNNINIGIAVARADGNLIVPVIKNADQLSLIGLTKKINDLALRAKNNQLKPDEIQGGTYTVSNIGSFGNILGTPIINQPQVAIMAVGSIVKKPAVIETPQGDLIGIRHKMYLSHSYDHRVVDGALGGMFVKRVSDYLEDFDINQEI